jgi:hypothetical protein
MAFKDNRLPQITVALQLSDDQIVNLGTVRQHVQVRKYHPKLSL